MGARKVGRNEPQRSCRVTEDQSSGRKFFETSCESNSLVVIESLRGERRTGLHLFNDLEVEFRSAKFGIEYVDVARRVQMQRLFTQLTRAASDRGLRPILHLEAHGTEHGDGLVLAPSGETVAWDEFALMARALNVVTANNLVVVLAVCRGFKAVLAATVVEPVPFCLLVGPDRPVTNQQILSSFGPFYRTLISLNEMGEALRHLPAGYAHFNCEELFAGAMASYFRRHSAGRGRRERVERLVSEARSRLPATELRSIRRLAKEKTRATKEVFDRFKRTYLMTDIPANTGRFKVAYDDVVPGSGP